MKRYLLFIGMLGIQFQLYAQVSKQQADTILSAYITKEIHDAYWLYDYKDTVSFQLTIKTWQDTFSVSNVYAYFIDEKPCADWNHPCRYIFIDKYNGTIKTRNVRTPPITQDWTLRTEVPPIVNYENVDVLHTRTPYLVSVKSPTQSNDYAIIISGGRNPDGNYERYWNNCSFIYKVLVGNYGYNPNHIVVVMSDGTNPAIDRTLINGNQDSSPLDLDGNGTADVQYSATIANISNAFDKVAQSISSKDNLFVYVTDHGEYSTGYPQGAYMYLWNNVTYYPYQLEAELNKIKANSISVVMNQCYSGGFISALAGPGRVIMTACATNQVAYATNNLRYSEFSYHWISAMAGAYPDGKKADADANKDGYISMEEAFLFAKKQDQQNETPQYSSVDETVGKKNSLSGFICPSTDVVNTTITNNQQVNNCSVNVQNATVKNGAKLTISTEIQTLINGPFEVEKGGELEIK